MFFYAWLKRLLCRRLLTLVLFSYFLMILLFVFSLDFAVPETQEDESFAQLFPEASFNIKRGMLSNRSANGHKRNISNNHGNNPFAGKRGTDNDLEDSHRTNVEIKFVEPVPLLEPLLDDEVIKMKSGDFISLGVDAYVYSAFMDDRKERRFIRIIALMSQVAARDFIYCHFNDSPKSQPTKSNFYQLCENHNNRYGGYFYSCPVPEDNSNKPITRIVISFTVAGPRVKVPLQFVQPLEHKLAYLNLYPEESNDQDNMEMRTENVKLNVPLIPLNVNSPGSSKQPIPSRPTLSFAVCVSPLFGNISLHRLVEFVELTRLLGADHFIFYNHSVPQHISRVLKYYMKKKMASVLPWNVPPEVASSIWYHGQLLANNDCLYRTMPHFDLVSFHDIDEFIVPHSNATTWKEAFSSLLTDDRCGFSFQSAFYDPGVMEPSDSTLLTPALTAKSEMFSKVRTKVMVCPWRVFEVGIHHISKQNKENWHSWGVPTSLAYLHHYRHCLSNFGMRCDLWERDLTIANKYLKNLTLNYKNALNDILLLQENVQD